MTTTAPPLLPGPAQDAAAASTRSWSGREHARHYRGLLVLALAVAVIAVGTVLSNTAVPEHGNLDPLSYDPSGGRALATLLGDRGVTVSRVNEVDQALAMATAGSTVLVADPAGEPDLTPLRRLPGGVVVVLVEPDDDALSALQPGLDIVDSLDTKVRQLDCQQTDAVLAGAVDTGGDSYDRSTATPAQSCYDGTVRFEPRTGGGAFVDLGSAATLSNADLGNDGNAALGIGLLSHGSSVLWLVPGPVQTATNGTTPLSKLLPGRLGWAVVQGIVAIVLLMLWRARRLGRVVVEPLPVVIRASETVEGLGRLYRAGRTRRRAATALRAAALSRMAGPLGVRRDEGTQAMASAVSSRTGRAPNDVTALLYGAPPEDDRALVALADQLDALEAEVRRS